MGKGHKSDPTGARSDARHRPKDKTTKDRIPTMTYKEMKRQQYWDKKHNKANSADTKSRAAVLQRLRDEMKKEELVSIMEGMLSVTDEWGGSKLAGWRWGCNVLVDGIEDTADTILEALQQNNSADSIVKCLTCGKTFEQEQICPTCHGDHRWLNHRV